LPEIEKMKIIFWIQLIALLLVAGSGLIIGCRQSLQQTDSTSLTAVDPATNMSAISTRDAFILIQNNQDNPDFIIIDVRTAGEFAGGHIANAVNIDYYSPDFKSNLDKLDRNKEYLIYCRTGIRGAAAIKIMIELGFTRRYNLSGGIVQWVDDGYSILE
jgi:rhodanese-related sulfurtransferase